MERIFRALAAAAAAVLPVLFDHDRADAAFGVERVGVGRSAVAVLTAGGQVLNGRTADAEQHGGLLCIADHEGAYVDAVPGVEVFGVGERRCFVIPSVDGRNGNDVSVLPGKRRGRVLIGIGRGAVFQASQRAVGVVGESLAGAVRVGVATYQTACIQAVFLGVFARVGKGHSFVTAAVDFEPFFFVRDFPFASFERPFIGGIDFVGLFRIVIVLVVTGQKTFGIVFEEHVALVGAGTVAVNLGVGRFYPSQPVFGCYVGMFGLLRIVGIIRVVRIFRFVLSHAPLGDGDIRGFSAAGDDDDRLAGFGRFVFSERDGNRVLAGVARSGVDGDPAFGTRGFTYGCRPALGRLETDGMGQRIGRNRGR